MIAMQLAVGAEYAFECAAQAKRQEGFIYKLNQASLNEWLSLYKNHRRIFNLFKTTFIDSLGLMEAASNFTDTLSDGLREIKKYDNENIIDEYNKLDEPEKLQLQRDLQEGLKETNEKIEKIYNLQLQDIQADINNEIDVGLENRIKKNIDKPEIRFLFQVFLPCFLLYKHYPIRMLREARKGNIEYIEKLIRLDDFIRHDKKISDYLFSKRDNKIIKERIASAISTGINEKVTKKKMKMNLAGLISFFSTIIGNQLNEREIRDLFDAIAKDKGEDEIDIDLPPSHETFYKAIQRERQSWANALNNKSFTAWLPYPAEGE